jgi:hypothetical protein
MAVRGDGAVLFSSEAGFTAGAVTGADEDVAVFVPTALGATTAESIQATLALDGSAVGLDTNDAAGFDLP